MYADYPDSDPEGVARLSEELNRPAFPSPTNAAASGGVAASLTVPASVHFAGGPSASGSGVRPDNSPRANSNTIAPGSGTSIKPGSYTGSQILVPKYLEVCANTGKLRQSLREIDVTRFSGDIELFRWVRKSYAEMRGWRTHRRFCLRPKSMRFVYFGLEQRDKVHILCKDESYPSQDAIKAQEYHYTPCPVRPKGSMPMPSDTFIHYLHYCNLDVDVLPAQRTWLDRLPKKVREPLLNTSPVADGSTLVEAWGVHIIEGVDSTAVLWTTILVLFISLGPLLAAYISMTGDVQSATGVASVVLGVIAMLWMCLQVEVGRNT